MSREFSKTQLRQPRRVNLRAAEAFLILARDNSSGDPVSAEQITGIGIALAAVQGAIACEKELIEEDLEPEDGEDLTDIFPRSNQEEAYA